MNWQFWKKIKNPVFCSSGRILPKLEDITMTRNIQERLASMELGHFFAVATREGHKVFQLVRIEPYTKKKI